MTAARRHPTHGPQPPASLAVRLAWFVGLWAAGVAVTGLVGLAIRFVLK